MDRRLVIEEVLSLGAQIRGDAATEIVRDLDEVMCKETSVVSVDEVPATKVEPAGTSTVFQFEWRSYPTDDCARSSHSTINFKSLQRSSSRTMYLAGFLRQSAYGWESIERCDAFRGCLFSGR